MKTATQVDIISRNHTSVNDKLSDVDILDLFKTQLEENSIPLEKSFHQTKNSYSALITRDVILNRSKRIVCNGLINKLELINYPNVRCILNFNGMNVATSKLSKDGNYFDIKEGIKVIDSQLELMHSITCDEIQLELKNHEDFMNFNKILNISIIIPKEYVNFAFDEKLQVIAHGYFYNKGNLGDLTTKTIDIYPHYDNTISPMMHHPTDSIDLYVEGKGTVICYVNGEEYSRMHVGDKNSYFEFHRMKFNDEENYFHGLQNNYLSDEINKNTINFSRVDNVNFITIGCKINKINQHYYETLSYPGRYKIFSN